MRMKLLEKIFSSLKPWLKKNYLVVLAIVALLAMGISLAIGLLQSVWFDEAYSVILAKKSFSEIIRLTSGDVHPPLYYFLLHIWGNIFGWSDLALRGLSVLAMGGAIFVAGLLTKKMFGLRAAYFVLPFITFSPFLLRYGFEIRMYSIASLIGISATYVLMTAVAARSLKKQLFLYGIYAVLVAAGMMTLYYMALLWLGHFTWLVVRTYRNSEPLYKAKWMWSYFCSILLFLPWLFVFFKQADNGAISSVTQSMTVENLIGIVSFSFLYQPVWQLDALSSLIVIFLLATIGYVSVSAFRKIEIKDRSWLILLILYILVPVAILTLIGLFRPMYLERYLSHVVIGGLVFLGVASSIATRDSRRRVKYAVALMVFTIFIGVAQLCSVGNYNFQRLLKPSVEQASSMVTKCDDENAILAGDPYLAIELSRYVSSCDVNFYYRYGSLVGGYEPLSETLRIKDVKSLESKKTIYYMYYDSSSITMPDGFALAQRQRFDNLTVDKYVKIY